MIYVSGRIGGNDSGRAGVFGGVKSSAHGWFLIIFSFPRAEGKKCDWFWNDALVTVTGFVSPTNNVLVFLFAGINNFRTRSVITRDCYGDVEKSINCEENFRKETTRTE